MVHYSSFRAWINHFLACMGDVPVNDFNANHYTLDGTKPTSLSPSPKAPIEQFRFCNLCKWKLGCFGCCAKSQPIIAVDEPSKGLRIQGQEVKKPSISEDFWSTSTCDMDNSQVHSQRSLSSISLSNQSLNQYSGTGSTSNCSEFVNHGLLRWNQTRLLWNGSTKSQSKGKVQEPVLNWNASYESLLGTSKRFPQPIPLSEMVEFLVEIWEQEGMYD